MKTTDTDMTDQEPPDGRVPIIYRPWLPEDAPDEVTDVLHRAFARLVKQGLACASATQSAQQTLDRIQRGHGYVAVSNGHIIGTLTLYEASQTSPAATYRDVRIASIHQFAVDPNCQGQGVGGGLLRLAECRASCLGYSAVALDTPQEAWPLIAYYIAQGFRVSESLRFAGRGYVSQVLKKPLASQDILIPATAWV